MAIGFYAAQAHTGAILSLDDPSLFTDRAQANGSGGVSYTAYMLSGVIAPDEGGGFAKVRRWIQRVPHDGAVLVVVTPWFDGQDSGQSIRRQILLGENPTVTAPLNASGSTFQLRIEVSAFDAGVSVGAGEFTIVPRRTQRGGGTIYTPPPGDAG